MTDIELIQEIIIEMERVWGDDGFGGSEEEYEWLLANYGISEDEDVKWQLILQESLDDLPIDDAEDPEVMDFLEDDAAVYEFLEVLLAKYKKSAKCYQESTAGSPK